MLHCNCQTKAGKKQSWRAAGLARPGKVGRAFSNWYQSVRVPTWQLQQLQSCRPDRGVHYSHCEQPILLPTPRTETFMCPKLGPSPFLASDPWQKALSDLQWLPQLLTQRIMTLLQKLYLSFSFPECDNRFSWTLMADQETYGTATALFPNGQ